jgi:DNA-binding NtrC family response regulator
MNRPKPSGPEDDTRKVRFKEILVVDQDEAWALVMRDAVAGGGFCVTLASATSEAIRKIREKRPDLVLLSCLMDPEESPALLVELDTLGAPPPVVLVGLATGDARWDSWKGRSYVSVVRQPFKSRQLLDIALALLGTTWEELSGDAPRPLRD